MQITEALIQKFLNGHCTPAEADFVSRYFRDDPEVGKKYLMDSWDEEMDKEELPDNYKELMLQEIVQKAFRSRVTDNRRTIHWIGLRFVAAASVILVFTGIWLIESKKVKQKKTTLSAQQINSGKKVIQNTQTAGEWQVNTNHTDQKLIMKLEDGSVVTLFPQSSIRFEKHFAFNTEHKRDIFLQGQAFFNAAKDKGRPLTVYAGDLATTVLGTSFSVHESETGVLVKLYSGKVMVHAVETKLKAWKKNVFLLPGEELKFEKGDELATVSSFETEKQLMKKANVDAADDNEEMVFDNSALPDVMNKLSRHYHTPIDYKKMELSNMYFSGSILKTDSLSLILKVIANMNGLQITQTTDGFMVHPSKN
jgi:ferric-dicitrate binding protein FerR (iron transport regulator)